MAITFLSATHTPSDVWTSANQNPGEPAGTVQGTFLLGMVVSSGSAPSLPTGWTSLYSGTSTNTKFRYAVGYIVRGASAAATQFTNSGTYTETHILAFSGVDTVSPIDSQSASGSNYAGVSYPDPPSTTAVSSAAMAVCGGISWSGTINSPYSAPANYTVRSYNITGIDGVIATRLLSASGAEDPGIFTATTQPTADDGWNGFTITLNPLAPATATQTHFKFRNDDGSESTATELDGEDSNTINALNTNTRLRVQVDTTGDEASAAYQLEYRKVGETPWLVTAPAPTQVVVTRTTGTTWVCPDDVFSIKVECWGGGGAGARAAANSTPGGGGHGGGYAVRNAMAVTPGTTYTYNIGAGGVSATPANGGTTAFTGDGSVVCRATGGVTPAISSTTGATTENGTAAGDTVRSGGNGANGSGSIAGGGGEAGGSDGVGNNGSGSTGGTGGNTDGGAGGAGRTGTNGAGTAGTAPGGGGGGAYRSTTTSNNGGAGALGQIKITYTATPRIVLSPSANIAASAATATTAQLSVPSGHSFTAGKISDDTTGLTVDIANNNYTELEWCLQAQSPAVNTDVYEFRVTQAGVALDTYSVTPQWTIGTHPSGVSYTPAAATAAAATVNPTVLFSSTSYTPSAATAAAVTVDPVVGVSGNATVTQVTPTTSTTDAGSYTSASFTPALGDLLVVFVSVTANTSMRVSVTDTQSLGFSLVTTSVKATSADAQYVFVANNLAAASSMTVTFNTGLGTATGCVISILRVAGMSRSGLAAIRQTQTLNNQSAGTPAPAFNVNALSFNPTLGFVSNAASPATITEPTGWTEGSDVGISTPTMGAETVYRNNGFSGSTITWGGTTGSAYGLILVELDATAATGLMPDSVASTAAGNFTGTSTSWTHVCSGTNRLLLVTLSDIDNTGGDRTLITGVTYNGVAMKYLGRIFDQGGSELEQSAWILVAPPTGSHSVVVSHADLASGGAGVVTGASISFVGAHQTYPTKLPSTKASGAGGTQTYSITVEDFSTSDGDYLVGWTMSHKPEILPEGTQMVFANQNGMNFAGSQGFNASLRRAESGNSFGWTQTSTDVWSSMAIAIRPASATPTRPVLDSVYKSTHGESVTSVTIPNVVSSGMVNGLMFYTASYNVAGATNISSVVWNGQSFTKLDSQRINGITEIWYLKNPAAATGTLTATFSASITEFTHNVSVWGLVDQTTPFGTVAKASGTAVTSFSVTVSSTATAIVQDVLSIGSGASIYTKENSSGGEIGRVISSTTAGLSQARVGASSVVMDWTVTTGGGTSDYGMMGVGINYGAPTGGGVTVSPTYASAAIVSSVQTIILGSVSATPAASTSACVASLSSTILGSISITPSAAVSVAAVVQPTVIQASITVVPSIAASVSAVVAPGVILGSIIRGPPAVTGAAVTVGPTVRLGSLVLSPSVATAASATVDPTVLGGGSGVTPAAATAAAVTVNPTVALSSVTAAPLAATAATATSTTTILGSITLTPSAATIAAVSVSPTVVLGSITVAPTRVSGATTTSVTVVLGSLLLTPSVAVGAAATINPTVKLGSMTFTPSAATAVVATVVGSVTGGGFLVVPAAATAAAAVVAPTVILSSFAVTPLVATSGAAVVGPTVFLNSMIVAPTRATAVATIGTHTVLQVSLTLSPTRASAASVTVNPSVIQGSVAVSPSASTAATTTSVTVRLGSMVFTPASATAATYTLVEVLVLNFAYDVVVQSVSVKYIDCSVSTNALQVLSVSVIEGITVQKTETYLGVKAAQVIGEV